MYFFFYVTHVLAVCLSGTFFVVRGIWMLQDAALPGARWVRISPHVIDTFLLLAAIGLMVVTEQYPGGTDWLTVKIVALLAYIGLGTIALRRGRTKQVRAVCFGLAVATFGFMISVALTRSPAGIFSLI